MHLATPYVQTKFEYHMTKFKREIKKKLMCFYKYTLISTVLINFFNYILKIYSDNLFLLLFCVNWFLLGKAAFLKIDQENTFELYCVKKQAPLDSVANNYTRVTRVSAHSYFF